MKRLKCVTRLLKANELDLLGLSRQNAADTVL